MISYYDIRDARTAMRALQNKPLRRRKLDIHFSIPKVWNRIVAFIVQFGTVGSSISDVHLYLSALIQDNPSERDVNQGTLVVFNLDPSVSNDDLRQIFGAYGEVKEVLLFEYNSFCSLTFWYSSLYVNMYYYI